MSTLSSTAVYGYMKFTECVYVHRVQSTHYQAWLKYGIYVSCSYVACATKPCLTTQSEMCGDITGADLGFQKGGGVLT